MAYTVGRDNYNAYKADFNKDTGLDYATHKSEYISYYNARTNDTNCQINAAIINEIASTKDAILALSSDIRKLITVLSVKK